jgi:hypothetical protein
MTKKAYSAPELKALGDIREVTQGAGTKLNYDGGFDIFSDPDPVS